MSSGSEDPTATTGEPDPVASRASLKPGTRVGRYLVLEAVGRGGMGEVYKALDPELDRLVALKLVHAGVTGAAEEAQARLLREAQALAKLSHPNVVGVFDAGTHDDRVYIAMEYVPGCTLDRWQEAKSPDWRTILRHLLAAGEALCAAHAQGLVHRDFKPGNVMVGDDDRVRVLDFGLARRWSLGDTPDPSLEDGRVSLDVGPRLDVDLTRTGTILGTPAYMAPEQFGHENVTAAADQFAFCVVVYRMLYGERPFEPVQAPMIRYTVRDRKIRAPPRASPVPRAIWPIVERGLHPDPQSRWPSMREVLHRLERVLGARRRRLVAGMGLSLGVAVAGLVADASGRRPCAESEDRLTSVWNDVARDEVHTAFTATRLPFAEDAWRSVGASLDRHGQHYAAQRLDACEATHVRAEQSPDLMDRRMACLDRWKVGFVAMVDVLRSADAEVVTNAAAAVLRFDDIEACSDVARLTAAVAPPSTEIEEEVRDLQSELAPIRARVLNGKLADSRGPLLALVERVQEAGYDPLTAEAEVLLGSLLERLGQPSAAGEAYERSLVAAARCGDRHAEVEALIGLVSVRGVFLAESDEAHRLGAHADALVAHLGDPPSLRGRLENQLGGLSFRSHDIEEATAHYDRALEAAGDDESLARIRLSTLGNLSTAASISGRYDEALRFNEQAMAVALPLVGDQHPLVGKLQNNLAITYTKLERYEEAREAARRSIEIHEKTGGEESGEIARAQHALGQAHYLGGLLEPALAAYSDAYAIKRRVAGERSDTVAFTANDIGMVHFELGHFEEALRWLGEARSIWAENESADEVHALSGLAETHLALENLDEALEHGERGLSLVETHDIDPWVAASVRFALARILGARGEDPERAVALAEAALENYRATDQPDQKRRADLETWLAAHRRPSP